VLSRSILSLSIDPPRFLLCVPLSASAHDPLMRCDQCGVSFLSEGDVEEVTTFLDPDRRSDRFRPSRWILRAPDPPRLRRALGAAFCTVTSVVAADDHSVFVLTASSARSEPGAPLIAFDHRLRILAAL
jgi:flavin reductase (DIM6/NTAB) family NADH-FMN oxidoreductase RutF